MSSTEPGVMNGADVARTSLVIFLVLAVQQTLLDNVRVGGAHPEVMFLVAAAAGYVGGPQRGAIIGFFTGLVADLLLPTTFGFSALVGCLVGYVTGSATSSLVRSSRWLAVLSLTAGTVGGVVGYAGLAAMFGQPGALQVYLPPALEVAAPAAVVLALPVLFVVRWAVPPPVVPATTAPPGGPGW